jgi:Bacterial type II and III secretion system protein
MRTSFMRVAAIALVVLTGTAATVAQQPATAAIPTRDTERTPLTVQVVISRFQGEKKVSSMPYAMAVNANGKRAVLRMTVQVPMQIATPSAEGKPAVTSVNYRDVGTAIDCVASSLNDGRYSVELTVEDSSVYSDQPGATRSADYPSFRSFRSTNDLVLRDGQSAQLTMATDKVTGEVTRLDVSLTVGK